VSGTPNERNERTRSLVYPYLNGTDLRGFFAFFARATSSALFVFFR
jgi:hypothetical protein